MKKLLVIISAIAVLVSSCQKEPIGGTAVQDLSGQWFVQVDIADDNGEVVFEDFNEGRFILNTYNIAGNASDTLYVNDNAYFWDFIVRVPCNLSSKSFGKEEVEFANESYESNVSLWGGKIKKNGIKTPSGADADYIEFFVNFDDDTDNYPSMFGGSSYKVSGWRYTGQNDDENPWDRVVPEI